METQTFSTHVEVTVFFFRSILSLKFPKFQYSNLGRISESLANKFSPNLFIVWRPYNFHWIFLEYKNLEQALNKSISPLV